MRQSRKQSAADNSDDLNLGQLFSAALNNVSTNRQAINDLDGHNGNHGDNMVHNLQVVTQALQAHGSQPPADQLRQAAQRLQSDGRGSTGQYYAQGLAQAAQQFQGKPALNQNDVGTLLQSLMGNVPVKPAASAPSAPAASSGGELGALMNLLGGAGAQPASSPPPAQSASDPLSALLGLAGGQPQTPAANPSSGGAADMLGALLGMAGGQPQTPQPAAGGNVLGALLGMAQNPAPSAGQGQSNGLDLGDLLSAGMAFMQAKQQGADTMQAAMQALTAALMNGSVNPLQSGSPQAASGGLIAQSLLQAALGRK